MRTRAIFYIVLGALILGALLVLDLVAHSYTAIQGAVLELIRAGLQGAAMLWLARALEIVFFRTSSVSRPEEARRGADWPVRLVQRFAIILGASVLVALAPALFTLSVRHVTVPEPFKIEPATFPTVISIDILGAIWLMALVFVLMSFWQINLVRQSPRFARRRFVGWAITAAVLAVFTLWQSESVVPRNALTLTVYTVLVLATGLAALLLGYRLAWLPHASRIGKRKLLAFAALDAVLAAAALIAFGGDKLFADVLFERYALFWQMIAVATFGTLAIYFAMVFFSTLFSLSSTELVERKSAEVQSLAKLTRFSSDILSSELLLDLPRLAEQITSLACEATESDCAWLELRSSDDHETPVRCYIGIGERAAESIMEEAEGFPDAGRQVSSPRAELDRTRRPIIFQRRISTQQYLFPTPEQARGNKALHSMVAVPLLRKDEVRGGLYVAKNREDGFDDDDLTVLTAFTDVASLALETARLLQDSIEKQKFDGELRAARLMQKSLLPERFPNVPGFDIYAISIPAYDVGGDYYDASTLWDGSTMITIGDVSGKGISASLYMAETKGVVQALAPVMANMTELLEGTNEALMHNSPTLSSLRRSFVTLGLIAFTKRGVMYARAGHTPLLHVRADGQYQFYQPRGIAVGLIRRPDVAQTMEELKLEPLLGDVLVLFSDGITDARNPNGEELGYDRLAHYVSDNLDVSNSRDLTLKVLQSVAEFTQSGNFDDDATLVVMRCIE
ncbi:MAG: SpoIIE family protein phosphatase [Bacteroidota bacterium]|nr:SpoIIE family protein phosphatase [Bacteroidota bacterium]MDP4234226.1 SpoIIE family protein phosphatase [Bacteroidota bacterium]MDP4243416.1 SpoIIE family protein phosphatase [Bacteroidota bacterium]